MPVAQSPTVNFLQVGLICVTIVSCLAYFRRMLSFVLNFVSENNMVLDHGKTGVCGTIIMQTFSGYMAKH